MKTKQDIQNLLDKLPHHIQVSFALHCCNDIKDLIKDDASLKALELVEKWLKNSSSVTAQELHAVARVASVHASVYDGTNTAYATYAAANATYAAAHAANAANAAVNAASTASAAHAAFSYNKYSQSENQINQYYNDLLMMIKDMTDLEKAFLNL